MPMYYDDTATGAAWGAQPQPRPRTAFSAAAVGSTVSYATLPPAASSAVPFSAAAVGTSIVKGATMLGTAGGNQVEDAAQLQAEKQTAGLRKTLQSWGAQTQQDVGAAMAQPAPAESPSVFGPLPQQQQQQQADFDPTAVGADDVDESSFGL